MRKLRAFFQSPPTGFTLIELLVSLCLIGILGLTVSVTVAQIMNVNAGSVSRMTAVKQVENALDTMRVDIQVSQSISIGTDSGLPLILSWRDWNVDDPGDIDEIQVEYLYSADSQELKRQITLNNTISPAAVVAKDIQSIQVSKTSGSNTYSITITSFVDGYRGSTESRTIEVLPRPGI